MMLICAQCAQTFSSFRKDTKYCSPLCKDRRYRQAHQEELSAYNHQYEQRYAARIAVRRRRRYLRNHAEIRQQQQLYRETHAPQIAATDRAYREAHAEQRRLKQRLYRDAYPEKTRASNRQWREKNSDKVRANWYISCARYRARKINAPINDLTQDQWLEILVAYNHRCVYCGRKMQRLTQDHIVPLSKGGSHTASNVVPACKPCNSKKFVGPPPVPVQPILLLLAPARTKKRAG